LGSTAWGRAEGIVTALVVDDVVAGAGADATVGVVWLDRRVWVGSLIDPHPASTSAAIAVRPVARMR
jgi:hypothetical protein